MQELLQQNLEVVKGLIPQSLWQWFARISYYPRGSGNEAGIANFIADLAKASGLQADRDAYNNVVVHVPASPGSEDRPRICLQSHLDMVCAKLPAKVHDFKTDGIELVLNDIIVTANGTTLGADNGIGVAAMLAIMEDSSIQHGPLELLFTTGEEEGLIGASKLGEGFIESKIMINLDSEDWGDLYMGCAGGQTTTGTMPISTSKVETPHTLFKLSVNGLRGGHSGLEIHQNRGNAIKIIGEIIGNLEVAAALLASINAGEKHNAIPSEGTALVFVSNDRVGYVKETVVKVASEIKNRLGSVDPGLAVAFEEASDDEKAQCSGPMQHYEHVSVLFAIHNIPHGVKKMSDIPDLVQTSMNLAIIRTNADSVSITTSQRSMVASELAELNEEVDDLFEQVGATIQHSSGYPVWQPNFESNILKVVKQVYTETFSEEPKVKTIHAGLECAILGKKYSGMDMISFGPTIKGGHAPGEMVYIDTVGKFWKLLLEVLKTVQ